MDLLHAEHFKLRYTFSFRLFTFFFISDSTFLIGHRMAVTKLVLVSCKTFLGWFGWTFMIIPWFTSRKTQWWASITQPCILQSTSAAFLFRAPFLTNICWLWAETKYVIMDSSVLTSRQKEWHQRDKQQTSCLERETCSLESLR